MKNSKTQLLVEGAIMVALAAVLSLVKIFQLPWGGSVTLLSMLPITMYSIKNGVKKGLAVSFLYALVQLVFGITMDGLFGWGLTATALVSCIMLDYIVAFTVLGFAGMFRSKGIAGWITGTVIVILLRMASHFASGVFIFGSFGELWDGFSTDNTYLYSLLYNGSYMLPEMIFTIIGAVVLYSVPQTRNILGGKKAAE